MKAMDLHLTFSNNAILTSERVHYRDMEFIISIGSNKFPRIGITPNQICTDSILRLDPFLDDQTECESITRRRPEFLIYAQYALYEEKSTQQFA